MTVYAWIKLLHIAAIAVWSAALVYLPALFAEHPRARDEGGWKRLRHRTRLVYVGIASPAAVIAVVTGTLMIPLVIPLGIWLVYKLAAVGLLVMVHVYFGRLLGRLYERPDLRRPWQHLVLIVPAGVVIVLTITAVTAKPL